MIPLFILIIGYREVNEDNMLFRNIPGELLDDSLLLVSIRVYICTKTLNGFIYSIPKIKFSSERIRVFLFFLIFNLGIFMKSWY